MYETDPKFFLTFPFVRWGSSLVKSRIKQFKPSKL